MTQAMTLDERLVAVRKQRAVAAAESIAPSLPVEANLTRDEQTTVLEPAALEGFVETPYVKGMTERALCYMDVRHRQDYAGHARGQQARPAGGPDSR